MFPLPVPGRRLTRLAPETPGMASTASSIRACSAMAASSFSTAESGATTETPSAPSGTVARVRREHAEQALAHEPRRAEEHDRERDLDRHQHAAEAVPGVIGAPDGTRLLQDVVQVGTGGAKSREQAEEHRGEEDERAAVEEHPAVDVEVLEERHPGLLAAGNAGEEEREAQARGEEPEEPAEDREDETLGQQLPEQAATAGAERGPDGHLLLAGPGAGEEEVGHVGAGHEEHEGDAGEEEHEHRLHLSHQDVAERDHLHRHALHLVGEALAERGGVGETALPASGGAWFHRGGGRCR